MSMLDFRWFFVALAICLFPFSGFYIGMPVLKPYVLFGFIYILMASYCLSYKLFYYLKTPFVMAVLLFFSYVFLSFFWSDNQYATLMALVKITFVLVLCFVWAIDIRENNKQFISSVIIMLSALIVTLFSLWKCYLFGIDKISTMFFNGAVHSGQQEFTYFIKEIFVSYPISQYHHGIAIYIIFCFGLILLLLRDKPTFVEKILIAIMSFLSVITIFMTLSKTAIIAYFFLTMALLFNHRPMFLINVGLCSLILISNPLHVRNAFFERFSIVATVYDRVSSHINLLSKKEVVVDVPPKEVVVDVPPKEVVVDVPPKEVVVDVPPKEVVVDVPPNHINTFDAGVSERAKLWSTAISLFKESPWFGHGYRALGEKYDTVSEDDAKYPHNIVLQILSELGVMGFFLSLMAFYYLVTSFWNVKDKTFFGALGFVLMSLSSIMISLQLEEFYIWLGFFLIALHGSLIGNMSLKGERSE